MSARWSKPKCASGKAAFRSKGEATRKLEAIALSEQQAAVRSVRIPKQAYHCKCGAWHLSCWRDGEHEAHEARTQAATVTKTRPRRPKRSAPRARHLFVAPELLAAPPAHKPEPTSWLPSDPITSARLKHWERLQGENTAAYLQHPFPWPARKAAA